MARRQAARARVLAAMGLSSGWGSNWRGEFTQDHRRAHVARAWTEAIKARFASTMEIR